MSAEQKPLPTIAETLEHPAYPGTIWDLEPHLKGQLPVAKGRGGLINIAWEVHGDGPIKLALIMGLAGVKTAWQRQTKYFGHDLSNYSVLIVDNRGIGESDKPLLRYTTSAMALDYIEVLAHLSWIPADWASPTPSPAGHAARSVHLAGISLGGMIAQEIAQRIPANLASLTLLCTAASVESTKGWVENARDRVAMFAPKSMGAAVQETARNLFTEEWLRAADDTPLPCPGRTPRCGPAPDTPGGGYLHFDNNYQRFQAQELRKKLATAPPLFTTAGFLMQLAAAASHHKSPEQLREVGDAVGRERILVVHGGADRMIAPVLGDRLVEGLRPGSTQIVPDMGHAPIMERPVWLNGIIEEHIAACEGI